jgi:protein-disulfide isomerase
MHDQLFTHQQALEDRNLSRYAKHISLDLDQFARDMSGNTFLKQIETDYNLSVFDEHVTGTPTFYINGLRYTGATEVESLLLAIKEADTEGHIVLPEKTGLRGVLGRLHRRDNE